MKTFSLCALRHVTPFYMRLPVEILDTADLCRIDAGCYDADRVWFIVQMWRLSPGKREDKSRGACARLISRVAASNEVSDILQTMMTKRSMLLDQSPR